MKRSKRETKTVHLQDLDRREAMMADCCSIDRDEGAIEAPPFPGYHKSVPDIKADTATSSFSWLRL